MEEKENTDVRAGRKSAFRDIIDGSILTKDEVVRQLPFILFLTFLGIIYIGNRYHAERVVRETSGIRNELKDLRAEAITTASELMYISKQSEVAKLIEDSKLGLYESMEPPKKIVVD